MAGWKVRPILTPVRPETILAIMPLWFTKPEPPPDPLGPRVVELEAAVRSLRIEWSETVDRIEHLIRRLAKRQRDLAASLPPDLPEGGMPTTPSADPITERIHARRGHRVRKIG